MKPLGLNMFKIFLRWCMDILSNDYHPLFWVTNTVPSNKNRL